MKRFSHFQPKSQIHKKPKLDISSFSRNFPGPSKPREQPKPCAPPPAKEGSDNIWGDDDDEEIIMLASQAAEGIENRKQEMAVTFPDDFGDITFSGFRREVKSSTQLVQSQKDLFSNAFKEDDDPFANIEEFFCDEEKNENNDDQPFKLPSSRPLKYTGPNPSFKTYGNKAKVVSTASKENTSTNTNQTNKKNTNDIVNNYLMTKIDKLKAENEKLAKVTSEFNEKMQTKEGEVSVLRQELHHLKLINEKMRLAKLQENNNSVRVWQEKIADLEKVVKVQQSELASKNFELNNGLKESQLMDSTLIEEGSDLPSTSTSTCLHLLLNFSNNNYVRDIPHEIFEKSTTDLTVSFRENFFWRELETLQSALAQMQSIKTENNNLLKTLSQTMVESLKRFIPALASYVRELDYPKYRDTNASIEYSFLCQIPVDAPSCDIHKKETKNIHQESQIFNGEKAIVARRIISALPLTTANFKDIYDTILKAKSGDQTFFQIIIDCIELIGFSTELFHHSGVLEALSSLLRGILDNSEETTTFISKYIKFLIFCRPTIRPLVELSYSMVEISSKPKFKPILNSLCTRSSFNSFYSNEFYKIIQFSPNSCPLQVYGVLLEAMLPQHKILYQTEIDALSVICYNHMMFFRNAFKSDAHWIRKFTSESLCDCYIKVSISFIVLFHLLLSQWLLDPKCIDIKNISKICQTGSLLLYDIFHKNYKRTVLQNGGNAIKHRLQILFDWLKEHRRLFRFKPIHNFALESIDLSKIIDNPIGSCAKTVNEVSLLDGHDIWLGIFDEFMQ